MPGQQTLDELVEVRPGSPAGWAQEIGIGFASPALCDMRCLGVMHAP
jgi:hypothetical protein